MSDSKPVEKKASKPKAPPAHPKYIDMIKEAITSLKERGGSSRQAILKYICKNFKVGDNELAVNSRLKIALRAGLKSETLKNSKGTGASGSFKLGEAAKKVEKPKKVAKPKAAKPKKPAAKRPKTPKKADKPKKAKTPKKPNAEKPKKADQAKKAKTPSKKKADAKPKKTAAPKPKKAATKKPAGRKAAKK